MAAATSDCATLYSDAVADCEALACSCAASAKRSHSGLVRPQRGVWPPRIPATRSNLQDRSLQTTCRAEAYAAGSQVYCASGVSTWRGSLGAGSTRRRAAAASALHASYMYRQQTRVTHTSFLACRQPPLCSIGQTLPAWSRKVPAQCKIRARARAHITYRIVSYTNRTQSRLTLRITALCVWQQLQ